MNLKSSSSWTIQFSLFDPSIECPNQDQMYHCPDYDFCMETFSVLRQELGRSVIHLDKIEAF